MKLRKSQDVGNGSTAPSSRITIHKPSMAFVDTHKEPEVQSNPIRTNAEGSHSIDTEEEGDYVIKMENAEECEEQVDINYDGEEIEIDIKEEDLIFKEDSSVSSDISIEAVEEETYLTPTPAEAAHGSISQSPLPLALDQQAQPSSQHPPCLLPALDQQRHPSLTQHPLPLLPVLLEDSDDDTTMQRKKLKLEVAVFELQKQVLELQKKYHLKKVNEQKQVLELQKKYHLKKLNEEKQVLELQKKYHLKKLNEH